MATSKKLKPEEAIEIIENVMIPQVNDEIARAESEMKKFEDTDGMFYGFYRGYIEGLMESRRTLEKAINSLKGQSHLNKYVK